MQEESTVNVDDTHPTIIQKGITLAKQKIEDHYSDKFTYALPAWAMLTGKPEIMAIVHVRGNEGIRITQQRVDFEVDFRNQASIQRYADHLNSQMDIALPPLGYILFYKYTLTMRKDPAYSVALGEFESSEITRHNSNNTTPDFSFIFLTENLESVGSTADLQQHME